MNEEEFEGLAGGPTLRALSMPVHNAKQKRPATKLRDALVRTGLTMPLFVLIARQRDQIAFYSEEDQHMKLMSDLLDKVS